MIFENINSINVNSESTWLNKAFLTFDTDWCSDEVLSYTLDILEKYNLKATIFCTHKTVLMERMRKNINIELGIHPNFNFLLNGDFRYGANIKDVIKYYLDIVPDAVSVRSHSLTQQWGMINDFYNFGLTHEANIFLPKKSLIIGKPFIYTEKPITRIPAFYMDIINYMENRDSLYEYLKYEGIKVFIFHPIHIALNIENIDRYARVKNNLQNSKIVFDNKYKGYGVKDFLIDIIEKGSLYNE